MNPRRLTGNCIIESKNGVELLTASEILYRSLEQPLNTSIITSVKTTLVSKIGIRSMACRLPCGIETSASFWDFLVAGRSADIRIPASRIPSRNQLIKDGLIEGGCFLTEDISLFDASFFGISRVDAETMDPQQRILMECTYECMENAGLTTLEDTGFFIGFMGSEYANLEPTGRQSALVMLGSAASIVSGVNLYE